VPAVPLIPALPPVVPVVPPSPLPDVPPVAEPPDEEPPLVEPAVVPPDALPDEPPASFFEPPVESSFPHARTAKSSKRTHDPSVIVLVYHRPLLRRAARREEDCGP
jgi:hypothetical protein